MTFGDRAIELASIASSLLGWRPGEFWTSTPSELATALGLDTNATESVDRASIERLIAQFPDN